MTPQEVLNILRKTDIDCGIERFTNEQVNDCGVMWSFEEFMSEHYPLVNYEIMTGVTKCVIVFEDEDFVIKIPFSGYEDWEGQEYDSETDCYDEDYDPFFEFDEGDYCRIEANNYQSAIEEGLEEIFAETSFLGYANEFPIYVQKKVIPFWQTDNKVKHTFEERISFQKSYNAGDIERLPIDWCLDFIAAYGEEKFIDFLVFTIKYHINDLHGDNVAYRNGKPCLLDYSGYWK